MKGGWVPFLVRRGGLLVHPPPRNQCWPGPRHDGPPARQNLLHRIHVWLLLLDCWEGSPWRSNLATIACWRATAASPSPHSQHHPHHLEACDFWNHSS